MKRIILLLLFIPGVQGLFKHVAFAQKVESKWVYLGKDGKLIYKTTPAGDKIMDFSSAGYMGGGVVLPAAPIKRTLKPSGGNNDANLIQKALDEIAAMPLKNGFRGTLKLLPGSFICSSPIVISASGIIIQGSGSGKNGTIIKMTGSPHTAIVIGKGNTDVPLGKSENKVDNEFSSVKTLFTDAYVSSGSVSFNVADNTGFVVGDTISIRRPITEAWVHFMGMDNMSRNGKKQTWITKGTTEITKRKIIAIHGNKITINIPLANSYPSKFLNPPGVIVSKVKPSSRVTQVGIENLQIQCPPLDIDYAHAPYAGIRIGGDDCWVKDVYCEETMNTTVLSGNRITMQEVVIKHSYTNLGASKPTDFSIEGSQNLIDRCKITGGNTYFVWTSALISGPNVLLNCTFKGLGSRIQPHQRWSTGLLVDNCTVPDGGIDFMNRGIAGSGHGWTMGWAVAWNCIAKTYVIQNPPGVENWAIGCIGKREQTARLFDSSPILPEGNFDSHGVPVSIQSLYLAQLAERLSNQALKNIGYASNTKSMFLNKSVRPSPVVKADNDALFGKNLAFGRPVNTSSVRGVTREFGGEKALDGNSKTYWATVDGITQAALEVDLEGPVEINALKVSEALGPRVKAYQIEAQVDNDWKVLAQGTTIGENKVARFPKVIAWKVRLKINKATGYPAISHFGLYLKNDIPSRTKK